MKKTKLLTGLTATGLVATSLPLVLTSCSKEEISLDASKIVKNTYGELDSMSDKFCVITYDNLVLKNGNVADLEASVEGLDATFAKVTPILKQGIGNNVILMVVFESEYYLYGREASFNIKVINKKDDNVVKIINGFSTKFILNDWEVTPSETFSEEQQLVTAQSDLVYAIDGSFSIAGTDGKLDNFDDFYIDVTTYSTETTASASIWPDSSEKCFYVILNLENIVADKTLNLKLTLKNKTHPKWSYDTDLHIDVSDQISKGFHVVSENATECSIDACYIHDSEIIVPETINGLTVTKIWKDVFKYKYNLETLILPWTIQEIGGILPENILCGTFATQLIIEPAPLGETAVLTSQDENGEECNCIMDAARTTIYSAAPGARILSSVKTLNTASFSGLYSLEGIVIPATVETMKNNVFSRCYNLKKVTFVKNHLVTEIPQACFQQCVSLKTFDFTGFTKIGNRSFSECVSLQTISLPAGITEIGNVNPFMKCSGLTSISIADGSIYSSKNNGVAANCLWNTNTNTFISGCQNSTIPDSITKISANAFDTQVNLKNVTLPNSVIEIGDSAFENCSKLETINLSKVTKLGQSSFANCSLLKDNIELNAALTSIPEECFIRCQSITSINLENVTSVGSYAFSGCHALKYVTSDETNNLANAETIGVNSFANCKTLENIGLPKVTGLSANAFSHCVELKKVAISTPCTYISSYVFYDCPSLTDITLPSTMTFIEKGAFKNCTSLETINIPATIRFIEEDAFADCDALSTATFADTNNWKIIMTITELEVESTELEDTANAAWLLTTGYKFTHTVTP